ncbi:uncharacterized protein TRUGW13939_04700 [Talaromyces rugulosus]|uniref:Uncharacterized protein n=1 Tax=Talaromyces rugulosus TaxID=121627 RepID=A0A7H8QUA0_TALRU|nr:uncharacterized protein TRUGW13939_04700 [Talaromyces rugulosus]QKX57582.1 hypothetical protein TRUGW13939_04700 [Talaromyces rugulosus]
MSRARAVSEEPATDTGKRVGDTSVDDLFSAKRRRLSDYNGLEKVQLQKSRDFSQGSDNGGVRFSIHEAPTSVKPEGAGLDGSIALAEEPDPCEMEHDSPGPFVSQQVSSSNSPATPIPSTDCENGAGDNEPTTEESEGAEESSGKENYPEDSSSRCPTPPLGVDVEMESVEDSQDMWTSATSSDGSEDKGVEIGYSGQRDNAFVQTYPAVSLPEQTIPASIEDGFGIFKAHIEDAFLSFKREIQSGLAVEDRSSIGIMTDMLAEKDGIIGLLKAEIDQLRNELEKCRELVHQHGKETEEWADRMMGLICRLPGVEGD